MVETSTLISPTIDSIKVIADHYKKKYDIDIDLISSKIELELQINSNSSGTQKELSSTMRKRAM